MGICLVGGVDAKMKPEANYTPEQWAALDTKVLELRAMFPGASVKGHNEFDAGKACPSFNVQSWLKSIQ